MAPAAGRRIAADRLPSPGPQTAGIVDAIAARPDLSCHEDFALTRGPLAQKITSIMVEDTRKEPEQVKKNGWVAPGDGSSEEKTIDVRPAAVGDIGFLSALSKEMQRQHADALPHLFKQPSDAVYTEAFFRQLLADPDSCTLVAWLDGEAVGFLRGQVLRDPETPLRHAWERVHFKYIAVLPSVRGKGCGHALLQAAVRYTRERGLTTITGGVWAFNTRMRAFLAKEGYTVYCEDLWLDVRSYDNGTVRVDAKEGSR